MDFLNSNTGFAHDISEFLLIGVESVCRWVGIASVQQPQDDRILIFWKHRTLLHNPAKNVTRFQVA